MRATQAFELVELAVDPAIAPTAGFHKLYYKGPYLYTMTSSAYVRDVVLDRPLDNFFPVATAVPLVATDTVLESFNKIQGTFNNMRLVGEVTGNFAYVGGFLEVNAVLASQFIDGLGATDRVAYWVDTDTITYSNNNRYDGVTAQLLGGSPVALPAGDIRHYVSGGVATVDDSIGYYANINHASATDHYGLISNVENSGAGTAYAAWLNDNRTVGTGKFLKDISGDGKAEWADIVEADISDFGSYIPLSQKGVANGVATLDVSGRVPTSQLPIELMEFLGNWNANTNTPALADTDIGKQGNVYRVSVAGSTDFGAGPISFVIGDWVYNTGTVWQKGAQTAVTPDLLSVLAVGNTTGANNISINSGQSIVFNTGAFTGSLSNTTLTAVRTYTLQDASGTLAFLSDITAAIPNTLYSANGSIASNRTLSGDGTKSLTFDSIAQFTITPTPTTNAKTTWTDGTGVGATTIVTGAGLNPTGFGDIGFATYVSTPGTKGYGGINDFSNQAVTQWTVYDSAFGVDEAGFFAGNTTGGGNFTYATLYHSEYATGNYYGFQANVFGERIMSQSAGLNFVSVMSPVNGLAFLSGAGGTGYIGVCNQAGFINWMGASWTGGTVTSVAGTTNRITISGTPTVAPIVDIAATYVGQTSITTLGTITTGTWNGTTIAAVNGGTGQSTYTTGDILYASAANVLSKLAAGTVGQVLTMAGGVPTWATSPADQNGIYTGSGALIAHTTVSGAFNLIWANTGNFERTGNISFTQGADRIISVNPRTGVANGNDLTLEAGGGGTGGPNTGGDIIVTPGSGGVSGPLIGAQGDIYLTGKSGTGIAKGSVVYITAGNSAGNGGLSGNIIATTGNNTGVGGVGGSYVVNLGIGTVTDGDFEIIGSFGSAFKVNGGTGKVTIPGLLDPIGLQMTVTAANPGDANTLWANSNDSNRPYWGGANKIAFVSDLTAASFYTSNGSIVGNRTVTGDESLIQFINTNFKAQTGDGAEIFLSFDEVSINAPGGLVIIGSTANVATSSGLFLNTISVVQQKITFQDLGGTPFNGVLTNEDITNIDKTWTLPNATGTIALKTDWETGATYTVSNTTVDRTYDADSSTVDELADILGTLIADLKSINIIQ